MVDVATVSAVFFAGAEGIGVILTTIAINLAAGAILGKILAPDIPKDGRDTKGLQTTVRSNVLPRRIGYGEFVAGGPYVLLETTGSSNEFLKMIVVITGHPVEDIIGVFLDDEYINVAGVGGTTNTSTATNDLDINYYVDTGKYGTGDAEGLVRIIKNNGWGYADLEYVTDKNIPRAIQDRQKAALIGTDLSTTWNPPGDTRDATTGLYNSGAKLTNCSYVYLSLEFEPDVWAGIPKVKFHVKGKKLYNPALDTQFVAEGALSGGTHDLDDPDTYEYSDDWTLCVLDYLTNSDYGMGAKTSGQLVEIDWGEAIQSYFDSSTLVTNGLPSPNTANFPRYTVNGIFETSSTPISIMESLLTSGAGELIYSQGTYKIRPGIYRPPASDDDIIDEDMIRSPLAIQTHMPRSELFNKAAGVFVDKGYDVTAAPKSSNLPKFEPSDFPIVDPLDSSGLNPFEEIDGEEIIQEFDFPFTINSFEAQRLARIALERIRRGFTVSFEASLEMLKYSVGDTVYLKILSDSKYANEVFFNRLGLDADVQTKPNSPITTYYKQFKITEMNYTQDFKIAVKLLEESEVIYDWQEGYAEPDTNALVSELVIDDPTASILVPNFVVASPAQTITESITWPNLTTYIRWTAPDRGSQLNGLDRAQIRSYTLQYGEVTDPSNPDSALRVANWIHGDTFIVQDKTSDIQGPIALDNLFIDESTDIDFRIRANLYNGRSSNWAYYSEDIGLDFSPTPPPSAEVSTPLAGQKTLLYNSQQTSLDTDVGFNAGEYALSPTQVLNPVTSYTEISRIYFCLRDKDNFEQTKFLNALRYGDVVTFYISDKRWFKYRLEPSLGIPFIIATSLSSSPHPIDEKVVGAIDGLTLIDYKDTDPSNVNTLTSTDVEFRFERDTENLSLVERMDFNFDKSIGLNSFTESGYWLTGAVNSPDSLELNTTTGEDGSGAVEYFLTSESGTTKTLNLTSRYYFKNLGTPLRITIRYKSISGTNVDDNSNAGFLFQFIGDKFPSNTLVGGDPLRQIILPATGSNTWDTYSFIFDKTTHRYLKPRLQLRNTVLETADIDLSIDNILIEPVVLDYGRDVSINSNAGSIYPELSTAWDLDLTPATGNVSIDIISNYETNENADFTVLTTQDSVNRTITWTNNGGGGILWENGTAPSLTTGAGSQDLFTFKTLNGGANWIGSVIPNVQ